MFTEPITYKQASKDPKRVAAMEKEHFAIRLEQLVTVQFKI